jgi:hypothetical protein
MKTQILTLAGFVWKCWPPNSDGNRLMMLGKVAKAETATTSDQQTKGILIPPPVQAATDEALFEPSAHIVLILTYTQRDGRLPLVEATKVEAFDGRATDEWKAWY